jgi:outer membrane biosynthesis protein TonB
MALPKQPGIDRFLKWVGASVVIHIALAAFLNFNPWPTIIKVRPTAYTVTLMPLSLREPEIPKTSLPLPKEEILKPAEKRAPIEKPKKDDIVEKVKKPQKEKVSLKPLQEALEEIRKKAALDEIRKRVARKEREEERSTVIPSVKTSPEMESKVNEYYSLVWAKIKGAWTIPENLLKETVDLETIIVVIIGRNGKIQKWWFEKKSGNALYDQSAMRAIKKAEPLPPIPKELSEDILEIGNRFLPD